MTRDRARRGRCRALRSRIRRPGSHRLGAGSISYRLGTMFHEERRPCARSSAITGPTAASPSACSTSWRQDEGPRMSVRPRRDPRDGLPADSLRSRTSARRSRATQVSAGHRGKHERAWRRANRRRSQICIGRGRTRPSAVIGPISLAKAAHGSVEAAEGTARSRSSPRPRSDRTAGNAPFSVAPDRGDRQAVGGHEAAERAPM